MGGAGVEGCRCRRHTRESSTERVEATPHLLVLKVHRPDNPLRRQSPSHSTASHRSQQMIPKFIPSSLPPQEPAMHLSPSPPCPSLLAFTHISHINPQTTAPPAVSDSASLARSQESVFLTISLVMLILVVLTSELLLLCTREMSLSGKTSPALQSLSFSLQSHRTLKLAHATKATQLQDGEARLAREYQGFEQALTHLSTVG